MKVSNYQRFRNRVLYPVSAVLFAVALYIAWFTTILFYGQPVTLIVVMALVVAGFAVANYKPRH